VLRRLVLPLVAIGLISQLIYMAYVAAFPLISNTRLGGPAADLEILMRDFRWFAPVYTAGIIALYFLFYQALQLVLGLGSRESAAAWMGWGVPKSTVPPSPPISQSAEQRLKLLILGFGVIFGFTLIWLYPITANDLFRYVLRGRIWAVYGESPMLTPPDAFPNDPYAAFAGEFGDWVSGYGPLWEILVQGALRLRAVDMVPGSLALKLLVFLFYVLCAWLLGWIVRPESGSRLAALTFFAWNPLILMQVPGNGHNDMIFMTLMVLGIILWQRKLWWAAVLVLTMSALAKATALLVIPLFGVVLLRHEPSWRQRLIRAAGAVLIGLTTTYLVYSVLGPVGETLRGVTDMLTTRRGFAIASGVRMVMRETLPRGGETSLDPEALPGGAALRAIPCNPAEASSLLARLVNNVLPCNLGEAFPRTYARNLFLLFYLGLLVQLWRGRLNLVTATFLAYFAQLMLGLTFRIWYPMWLIPLAAIHLTPATFWRTFLFGLTAELSIINYFVVWRWYLRDWNWDWLGLIQTTSPYWPVMHTLTVPWLFGLPLFGPLLLRWVQRLRTP
jgi:hypothetical protein